jgi:hypothetical protein
LLGERGGGEGAELKHAIVNRGLNLVPDSDRISQHLVAWNSQYRIAFFRQVPVSSLIADSALFGVMVFSVNLDDEHECNAAKVGGVGRNGVFATKLLISAGTIADHLPNRSCERIRPSALVSREGDSVRVAARSPS